MMPPELAVEWDGWTWPAAYAPPLATGASLRLARIGARLMQLPKETLAKELSVAYQTQLDLPSHMQHSAVDVIRETQAALHQAGDTLKPRLLHLSKEQMAELLSVAYNEQLLRVVPGSAFQEWGVQKPPYAVISRTEAALRMVNGHLEARLLQLSKERLVELLANAYRKEYSTARSNQFSFVHNLERALCAVNGTAPVSGDVFEHVATMLMDGCEQGRTTIHKREVNESLTAIVSLARCSKTVHAAVSPLLQGCVKLCSSPFKLLTPTNVLVHRHLDVGPVMTRHALQRGPQDASARRTWHGHIGEASNERDRLQRAVYDKGAVNRIFQLLGSAWARGAMRQLRSLSFACCDLSTGRACDLVTFCISVGVPPQLETLDFSLNFIGDAAISKISLALAKSAAARSIRHLIFRGNQVGDVGFTALIAASVSFPCLTKLNFCWNKIGDEGARVLAAALASGQLKALCRLELSDNRIKHVVDDQLKQVVVFEDTHWSSKSWLYNKGPHSWQCLQHLASIANASM